MSKTGSRVGTFTISPRSPLRLVRRPDAPPPRIAASTHRLRVAAGAAFAAYHKELRRLRATAFAAACDSLPPHLSQPLRAHVICTRDVVLVREDLAPGLRKTKVITGAVEQPPHDLAPMLSDKTLYLHRDAAAEFGPDEGVQIHLSVGAETVTKLRVYVAGELPSGSRRGEPRRLLQIARRLDVSLYGHYLGDQDQPTHEFIARAAVDLPVGWQRVIAFAPSTARQWTAELGREWALQDLTAAVFNSQTTEAALDQFDPLRSARTAFNATVDAFERMLEGSAEEPLHQFLRSHIELLFPMKSLAKSKVPFGNRTSDFVIRSADGRYTLVELENPGQRLFTQSGDMAADLTHATGQITSWRRYLEDNLRTVQDEHGLPGLTTAAASLVVLGRSRDVTPDNRRTLGAMQAQTPGLEILTYDDVVDRARTMCRNLFGPPFATSGGFQAYLRPYAPPPTGAPRG